jgi:hypothetical protein
MAINFPNAPSVNDTHTAGATTWIWTGTVWNIQPRSAVSMTVSEAPPVGPLVGDLWFESDTGRTFLYYDSSWVEISGLGGPSINTIAVFG